MFAGDSDGQGIQDMLKDLFDLAPKDHKADLAEAIVLAGGSTCFKNFDLRLESELKSLLPSCSFKIANPTEQACSIEPYETSRCLANWKGAVIQSQLSQFQEGMISIQEYEEQGANRICNLDIK
jgi:actin-related protein